MSIMYGVDQKVGTERLTSTTFPTLALGYVCTFTSTLSSSPIMDPNAEGGPPKADVDTVQAEIKVEKVVRRGCAVYHEETLTGRMSPPRHRLLLDHSRSLPCLCLGPVIYSAALLVSLDLVRLHRQPLFPILNNLGRRKISLPPHPLPLLSTRTSINRSKKKSSKGVSKENTKLLSSVSAMLYVRIISCDELCLDEDANV